MYNWGDGGREAKRRGGSQPNRFVDPALESVPGGSFPQAPPSSSSVHAKVC